MTSRDKDYPYKLNVNIILRKLGYVVFNELDLSTYSYHPKYAKKQITDLDVFGICCEADFNLIYFLAECKTEEKDAMEYLLKLKGLMDYLGSSKAYHVQKKIDFNARLVGQSMNILCLDQDNMEYFMRSLGLTNPELIRYEDLLYKQKESIMSNLKTRYSKTINYISSSYWVLPGYKNIIDIMKILDTLSGKVKTTMEDIYLIHYLILLLLIAIIKICGQIVKLQITDIENSTKTFIFGGARERRDREALFDEISKIVKDKGVLSTPYPYYLEKLTELINRYISSLEYSHKTINCMEFLINNILVDEKENPYKDKYDAKTLKLTRDVIYFVLGTVSFDRELFAKSLTENEVK